MEKPIKIKRYRKRKFTEKRDNYKNYNDAKWKWNDIFIEIDKKELHIKEISKKYNIKYKTLLNKYKKWNDDDKLNIFNDENRGGHKKIFTENEEYELSEYIKNLYIRNGIYFDNDCVKILALKKYNLIHDKDDNNINFNCSDGWVTDFKKRWKLITKGYNYCKKSIKVDNIQIIEYKQKCSYVDRMYYKMYIFNLDETFWKIINMSSTILNIRGEPRKFISNVDEKIGYTAIFVVSAFGKIFKPLIILK